MSRKLQEVVLAFWLEHKFSKDRDSRALSQPRLFRRRRLRRRRPRRSAISANRRGNVTLAEAALLAGLVKSPVAARADPQSRRRGAPRAQIVLAAMADEKLRSAEGAAKARARPPGDRQAERRRLGQLRRRLGDGRARRRGRPRRAGHRGRDHDRSGTADAAEKALRRRAGAEGRRSSTSAGRARRHDAGRRGARAGRRHATMPRASSTARSRPSASPARRSSRSSISPRWSAGSRPTRCARTSRSTVKGWKPENYEPRIFRAGDADARRSRSRSTPSSVRLTLEVGPQAVVRTAHRLGIASKLEPNASIALGTSEVSVMELVSAYVPFANGGIAVVPHVIERGAHGRRQAALRARTMQALGRVIDARYVAMMNQMMQETLASGTARKADLPRLAGRRQDRHQPGFPRRLVHRLHRASGRRRLARQRRQFADQEADRRRHAGRDLEPVHEGRASGRARRLPCRALAAKDGRRRRRSRLPPSVRALHARRIPTMAGSISGCSIICSGAGEDREIPNASLPGVTRQSIAAATRPRLIGTSCPRRLGMDARVRPAHDEQNNSTLVEYAPSCYEKPNPWSRSGSVP